MSYATTTNHASTSTSTLPRPRQEQLRYERPTPLTYTRRPAPPATNIATSPSYHRYDRSPTSPTSFKRAFEPSESWKARSRAGEAETGYRSRRPTLLQGSSRPAPPTSLPYSRHSRYHTAPSSDIRKEEEEERYWKEGRYRERSESDSRGRTASRSPRKRSVSPRSTSRRDSSRASSSRRTRSPSVDSLASSRASPIPGVIPVVARAPKKEEEDRKDILPPPVVEDKGDQQAVEGLTGSNLEEEPELKAALPALDSPKHPLDSVEKEQRQNSMAKEQVQDLLVTEQQISSPNMEVDLTLDDIPPLSSANTLREALRISAMTRHALQSTEPRDQVSSVLAANKAVVAEEKHLELEMYTNSEDLVAEVNKRRSHDDKDVRQSLMDRLQVWSSDVSEKADQLRTEYLSLHRKWEAHCSKLDSEFTSSSSVAVSAPANGRTTRRTVGLGDMVRSDLEMEQIIASLGIDDAFDPAQLSANNLASIPDMISVQRGSLPYTYDDSNLRVNDNEAEEYYALDTGIDDWDAEEEKVFMSKYAQYPKQFGLIATFLPNKSAQACVMYYYLRKKEKVDFRKVVAKFGAAGNRKKGRRKAATGATRKKKTNALLMDLQDGAEGERETRGRTAKVKEKMLVVDQETPTASPTPEPTVAALRRTAKGKEKALLPETASPTPEPTVTTGRPKRTRLASSAAAAAMSTPEVDVEEPVGDAQPKRKKARRSRVKSQAFVEDPEDLTQSLATNVTDKALEKGKALRSRDPSPPSTPSQPVPPAVLSANLQTLMQSQSLFTSTVNGYTPYGATTPSTEPPPPPLPSKRGDHRAYLAGRRTVPTK